MGAVDHRTGTFTEFEAFVAGAAGRLLHVAVLLTGEPETDPPIARRLLAGALARTYAQWHRLRADDPYEFTRRRLCAAYARTAWRQDARTAWRQDAGTGILAPLSPKERLVLVLRVYEGVAEEVTAAQLGLSPERVQALRAGALAKLRAGAADGGTAA
ncbi:sigma factor-like helix-turn-helix DNA-binding protein [Streptomyces sp. NPDC053429]|uniref:sigma factor-like helix-turn-helix DNA-binding protein n=1 Tax=Streptomyces sp. NPDC053429 TaxID=3365702 RepID=UPI0037CF0D0F